MGGPQSPSRAESQLYRQWGCHVIALGDGKFDVVGYVGGLPGDGWKRGDDTKKGKGELKDGVTSIKGDEGWTATIKDGVMTVEHEGNKVGELKKTERTSPTMGAKAPSGATVLFDGSSADAFKNGKIVEGNLLGATNCETNAKWQDHTLHIEFRTPYMPAARVAATAVCTFNAATSCKCSIRSAWMARTTNAAASTRSPSPR